MEQSFFDRLMFGMEEQHAAVLKLTMDKMDAHTIAVRSSMEGGSKTAFPF